MKRAEGSISGGFWAVETGARADGWLRARSDSRPKPWPPRIADRMGRPHWARFGAFFFVALCRLVVRIMTTTGSTKLFNAPLFGLGGVGLYTHNMPNYTVTPANLGRTRGYGGRQEGGRGLSLQAGNGGYDGRQRGLAWERGKGQGGNCVPCNIKSGPITWHHVCWPIIRRSADSS